MRRVKPKSDKTYADYVELQIGTKETARRNSGILVNIDKVIV
jgi:hypothetical protein